MGWVEPTRSLAKTGEPFSFGRSSERKKKEVVYLPTYLITCISIGTVDRRPLRFLALTVSFADPFYLREKKADDPPHDVGNEKTRYLHRSGSSYSRTTYLSTLKYCAAFWVLKTLEPPFFVLIR